MSRVLERFGKGGAKGLTVLVAVFQVHAEFSSGFCIQCGIEITTSWNGENQTRKQYHTKTTIGLFGGSSFYTILTNHINEEHMHILAYGPLELSYLEPV